jgi:hypothetical protein
MIDRLRNVMEKVRSNAKENLETVLHHDPFW